MSCASSSSLKRNKIKRNSKKRNIKSRKINKRERKMLVSKRSITLHGLPESIVSNWGPQFAVGLMKKLNRMLGIETKLSTAFHPQMDRQMECMN